MQKLIFRGALIRYVDLRQDDEAGLFRRIHFTADLSDTVCEAMEWGEPSEGLTQGKLLGELTATHLILTPNSKQLRQHELQLDVNEVSDFQFFRVKGDDGESTRTELRFIARSVSKGAGALLENYMELIGKGMGQLRIAYEKQEKLPLEGEAPADKPACVLCANGVPLAAGDDSTHENGRPCEAYEGQKGPALASAREAAGGTHQRGRRGQVAADPAAVQ